jgi:hypothetical protein
MGWMGLFGSHKNNSMDNRSQVWLWLGGEERIVSVVVKDCLGFCRPGGNMGEGRVGGRTRRLGAGDGGEGTQAREVGDRTLGEVCS